jgi:PPIC-type PPIASE domain
MIEWPEMTGGTGTPPLTDEYVARRAWECRLSFRRILREPLLHFLLIGLALFLYYGLVAPGASDSQRIVVSQAQVDDLVRQFQGTWNRPPTSEELASIVEATIRDEILYREGQTLGLDLDDALIKRRVRQKLEVIAEEGVANDTPTDADLVAYMQAHPGEFRRPALVSFEQVYFPGTESDTGIDREIAAALSTLQRGADPTTLGRATLLPGRAEEAPLDLVARDFGELFASQLEALPVGQWSGPVKSGLGRHLVRITAITPPESPPLEAVRTVVAREWESNRRRRTLDDHYRQLRAQYDVEIEAQLSGATAP